MRVWVDAWHLRCCGPPFEVGDRVAGPLATDEVQSAWLEDVLGADLARTVTFTQAHHDALPVVSSRTRGVVQAITATTAYASVPGGESAGAELLDVRGADGRDVGRHGRRLLGYVVVLEVNGPGG